MSHATTSGFLPEAAKLAPFLAVTIPELGDRPVTPKELRLNHQRRVAGPSADPNEIMVRSNGAVEQHQRSRRVAVLIDEPPPEVEQHNDEVLIDHKVFGKTRFSHDRSRVTKIRPVLAYFLF